MGLCVQCDLYTNSSVKCSFYIVVQYKQGNIIIIVVIDCFAGWLSAGKVNRQWKKTAHFKH